MRNKLIFCVSFFFLVGNLVAQNDDMVYDLNKSPEVVSFERQGRFNVNECSGSANINVPLHKIVYKDIELPLIINYNSKGVKVSSEASWVGLNWDLNIGGCVSVIPNGCFDYIDANSREQINKLLNKNNYNDYIEIIQDNSNEYSTTFHTLSELDFYSVTLPNANFYFFVDPETKNPTIIGSETDSYQIIRDSSVPSSLLTKNINGWTVKDGNGFTYEFTSIEKHDVRGNYEKYNVAWLLTKITSAQGNHLNLKYTDTSVSLLPTKLETQDVYLDIISYGGLITTEYDFSRHTSFSNQTRFMTKPYLKSIETDDQIVEFNKSGRDDICGALKLDQVVVKSKLTNETIRTINFGYDYFDSNNVGGNYLLNKFSIESKYLAKRLKLESIEFIASDKQKQQYTFEYEESIGFPQKTSSAVDMWGYYNGQANSSSNSEYKHTMIPCAMYCDVPANYVTKSTISNHEGANRFADPTKTSAFILKKITYPTKGYTKFEYESNTFMKYYENVFASGRIVSNSEKIEKKVMDTNSRGTDQDHLEFKLESAYVGTLTVNFVGYGGLKNIVSTECYIQLFEKRTNKTYIKYILKTINDNTSTNHTNDIKIKNLPAGEYVLIAKLPDNLGSGKGYVSGVLKLSTFVDTTSREIETYGGGLRIKAIASYEQGGELLEKTEYKYTQEDGKTTSGIHVNPTRLDFVKNIHTYQSGKYTAMTDYKILRLTSGTSGMTAFAAAMSPNDVCYSRVTKTKYTKNTDKKLKEISHYELYPLQLNLNNYLCSDMKLYNGNLSRKEYYDESDRLVRTETYSYKQDPYRYYKVNAKLDNALIIIGGTMSIAGTIYENYCYSFKSCWNRLVSIMQTDYRYDEVCNGMVDDNYTFTSFTYDPANKQISSKSISSLGTAYVGQKTSYIYSHTKSSMASQYLMNAVLQQTDSIISPMGNSVMKNQKIEYSNPREGVFLLSSVRDSIEGDMEERVHYGYDNNGNVNYILKDGTDQVVYLWSYSGSYPVAKIEGLTYSSVSNKLTSSFVSDLYSKIKPTESDYETIRTSLSSIGGLVTTYTYKPLVGVASQTLPNGVKTQFYYDGFGRLTETKDGKGKAISSIKYHTK